MEKGIIVQQPTTTYGLNLAPVGALEFLKEIDFIRIRQRVDLLEVFMGWQVANSYEVFDKHDRLFLNIIEESETCERICCGPFRGFVLHVLDTTGTEICRMHRRFQCCAGGCWCCGNTCPYELWVESPVGNIIAHIRQRSFCSHPEFEVLDAYEKHMFTMGGPCICFCQGPCCEKDLDFPVFDYYGDEAGKVTKIWDGAARACFTNANTFGCHFPANMDMNKKLAILGCVFEIDYLFFERKNQGGS